MPAKKKEKKYNFLQVYVCEKCDFVAPRAKPCDSCGCKTFKIRLEIQEIE